MAIFIKVYDSNQKKLKEFIRKVGDSQLINTGTMFITPAQIMPMNTANQHSLIKLEYDRKLGILFASSYIHKKYVEFRRYDSEVKITDITYPEILNKLLKECLIK